MVTDLPLKSQTPDSWAQQVMQDPLTLLNDHAHLERKAASNALELLNRWPDQDPPEQWVHTLAAVARDETDHLFTVVKLLKKRGGRLTRLHSNSYARGLRRLVRLGKGPYELLDRLLVSALIELRSCERFEVLSRCCGDPVLSELYRSLWGSEHGHYRVFLSLARDLAEEAQVERRWQYCLEQEALILAEQKKGVALHSSW